MPETRKASRFNAVAKAAKHLHTQHDEVSAGKLVASELRKARRARCRKRFIFWESVGAQLATMRLCQTSFAPYLDRVLIVPQACHSFDFPLDVG